MSQLESLLSSRGQSALFNVLVLCRLTDLVVWGSQRSYIDIQKAFVPSGFLFCCRMIMVLNMHCMLGRENGIIYVNIGYIFLTVLLGPAWDICDIIGKDSQDTRPVRGILTAALPIHKLEDFGMMVDGAL